MDLRPLLSCLETNEIVRVYLKHYLKKKLRLFKVLLTERKKNLPLTGKMQKY